MIWGKIVQVSVLYSYPGPFFKALGSGVPFRRIVDMEFWVVKWMGERVEV